MKKPARSTSIAYDYILFSVTIFLSIVLISSGFWFMTYRDELQRKHERLPVQATQIDAIFSDGIDYIAKYAEFIGERIAEHDPKDLRFIAEQIGGRSSNQPQEYNLYIATVFDWTTPDRQLRVSSKAGILKEPFDMSDRDYLQRTPLYPWTLQVSAPRYGGLSHQWIIPAGLGITDKSNRFLGTITLGVAVDGVAKRIAQGMRQENDIRYLIVSSDMNIAIDSAMDSATPLNKLPTAPAMLDKSSYLETPISYNGVEYSYVRKLTKYPYAILIGHSPTMAAEVFNRVFLSRMTGMVAIGGIAILMLYLLRRRLVRPVERLASAAEQISRGEAARIRYSGIREIDSLSAQLKKIESYIQAERQATEQLEQKTEQLEAANVEALAARDAAVKAAQAKTEFLANMSHELRTPMNAIVGLTNILLMKEFPPEQRREYIKTMQLSSHQLMQLINDLLDITKFETPHIELESIPFTPEELIDEVFTMQGLRASEKGILLTKGEQKNANTTLLGDPLRIRQVLMNLVSNAIKFTEKGMVIVSTQCRPGQQNGYMDVTVAVQDTGIGIPKEKLGLIFEKFTQADSSITRQYGGTGLGLSISKTLMELMGGTIQVDSKEGHGSCFTITVSLPKYAGDPVFKPAKNAMEDHPHKNTICHVLIVEDNKENILVAASLLESFGYTYEVANNGLEAVAELKRNGKKYDLILMDVQMPDMDGFEATRWIRNQEHYINPDIPIIGMTAYALAGDKERCLDAGMNAYIAKPFGQRELADVIAHYNKAKLH